MREVTKGIDRAQIEKVVFEYVKNKYQFLDSYEVPEEFRKFKKL